MRNTYARGVFSDQFYKTFHSLGVSIPWLAWKLQCLLTTFLPAPTKSVGIDFTMKQNVEIIEIILIQKKYEDWIEKMKIDLGYFYIGLKWNGSNSILNQLKPNYFSLIFFVFMGVKTDSNQ